MNNRPPATTEQSLSCTRAHSCATIRETGSVFFCCHGGPAIGNIRTESLSQILSTDRVQTLRKRNLEGRLHCRTTCKHAHHLVSPNALQENPHLLLDDILLMVALDCNIACTMCYQQQDRCSLRMRPDRRLCAKMLWRQIPFHRIGRVVIQGGEPTVIPEVLELLRMFNEMCADTPAVNLITNGLELPSEALNCIRTRSESICISINAATASTHCDVNRGSNWNRVLNNIASLQAMRSATNTHFKIVGGYTIVPRNLQEIPNFITSYRTLGFDSISFNYDPSALHHLAGDPKLHDSLRYGVRTALADTPSNSVRLAKLAQLDLI